MRQALWTQAAYAKKSCQKPSLGSFLSPLPSLRDTFPRKRRKGFPSLAANTVFTPLGGRP